MEITLKKDKFQVFYYQRKLVELITILDHILYNIFNDFLKTKLNTTKGLLRSYNITG